ncbi:MAG: aminopeptidase N [Burkholderiales bacterium]|nr:aminopeptidase N [Burkholderiales bacterium]
MSNPKTIHLKDYTPPPFLIDQIDLRFDIRDSHTQVHSRMLASRNLANPHKEMRLNGAQLELDEIALNGNALRTGEYAKDEDGLSIFNVPDEFILEITTCIHPEVNTSLMGLYRSNGNFYTQCEAEGFRKITYFPDRPDVMSRYSTTIIASKKQCPVLLSNGNLVGEGVYDKHRHWAKWVDPYRKPAYLFALVAGNLDKFEDEFVTAQKRRVLLQIYTEPGNAHKCGHAMASLKRAMDWDEQHFGLSYDLDRYMIVAVSDFNMGAMENKGLNIFNAKYVLATEETATDADFEAIEGVIGHEYFHNWTGNRVTCRDWFQLSLKEGLTVFRDQEFSADMNSRPVKRIRDVRNLKAYQFTEDAGPMAHPVRPESYIEISNFYTSTVYSKGAEVVRMMRSILNKTGFRNGMDEYFRRHDGTAVTTDDFVSAMEGATGIDLSQFRLWYSQAGTPKLEVEPHYDGERKTYTLKIAQSCPATPGQPFKEAFHIPVEIGLLGKDGREIGLQLDGEPRAVASSRILELRKREESFTFVNIDHPPVPSLLRGFSAPVKLDFPYSDDDLAFLMMHDTDSFNRWDAGQRLVMKALLGLAKGGSDGLDARLVQAFGKILRDSTDPAFKSLVLTLPSETEIAEEIEAFDPEQVHAARKSVRVALAGELRTPFLELYSLPAKDSGSRSLRNLCLGFLMEIPEKDIVAACCEQFAKSVNMTESLAALQALAGLDCLERTFSLDAFYEKWKKDALVLDKWFSIQATSPLPGTLDIVKSLASHKAFDAKNPNKVRALIGAFAHSNPLHFHTEAGYEFISEWVLAIDRLNPQVASRLASAFSRWKRIEPRRGTTMKRHLELMLGSSALSRDTFEIVSKSLS